MAILVGQPNETLEPGVSPLSIIEERDKRYEQMAKK